MPATAAYFWITIRCMNGNPVKMEFEVPNRLTKKPIKFVHWLIAIQLMSLLPMLVFGCFIVFRIVSNAEAADRQLLLDKTNFAAIALSKEVERVRTQVQLLALQEAAVADDVRGMLDLSLRVRDSDAKIKQISAVRRDGQLVFSTFRDSLDSLPKLSVPPTERPVFDSGATVFSGLLPLGIDGRLVIGVATPWRVNAHTKYSLRVALQLDELSATLRNQGWPPGWIAALIDGSGKVIARTQDEDIYRGKSATATALQKIADADLSVTRGMTLDGTRVLTGIAPVSGTDWWVIVGLPEVALGHQARQSVIVIIGIGALAVLLGCLASFYLTRRLHLAFKDAVEGNYRRAGAIREFIAFNAKHADALERLDAAKHDSLTGLPGRALFYEYLSEAVSSGARDNSHAVALLYLDLDGFKHANDNYGHETGDQLLVATADAIRRCVRPGDACGRIGGDEFVVAIVGPAGTVTIAAGRLASRLVQEIGAIGYGIGCSVGVAVAENPEEFEDLMERADRAMLSAKRAGKNRVQMDTTEKNKVR